MATFLAGVAFLTATAIQVTAAQGATDQSLIRQAYDYAFPLYLLSEYR